MTAEQQYAEYVATSVEWSEKHRAENEVLDMPEIDGSIGGRKVA